MSNVKKIKFEFQIKAIETGQYIQLRIFWKIKQASSTNFLLNKISFYKTIH